MKGSGSPNENVLYIVFIIFSPDEIFPNKRNENEIIFVISFENSKIPTNKNIGNTLKVINLVK